MSGMETPRTPVQGTPKQFSKPELSSVCQPDVKTVLSWREINVIQARKRQTLVFPCQFVYHKATVHSLTRVIVAQNKSSDRLWVEFNETLIDLVARHLSN
jgi:hypothetical protein